MVSLGFPREEADDGPQTVNGITPDAVGEVLELLDNWGGFRPIAIGDHFYVRSWDVHRVQRIFTLKDCPITVCQIDTGIDYQGVYRDIYHFEGQGWIYQLRHRPDRAYPEEMRELPMRAMYTKEYQRWAFEGDEDAFARDLVHAKLMLV